MKIFGNDEIIDADDMNYLSRRVNNGPYADEAARDQAIATPTPGQMVWVTAIGLMVYDGTAWRRIALVEETP